MVYLGLPWSQLKWSRVALGKEHRAWYLVKSFHCFSLELTLVTSTHDPLVKTSNSSDHQVSLFYLIIKKEHTHPLPMRDNSKFHPITASSSEVWNIWSYTTVLHQVICSSIMLSPFVHQVFSDETRMGKLQWTLSFRKKERKHPTVINP